MASITVSADASGNLTLSDNGNSNCHRQEQVEWVQGSGVSSISSVWAKSATPPANFWESGPAPNGNNFKGKISDTITPGSEWDYNIQAILKSGATSTLDPKITVY